MVKKLSSQVYAKKYLLKSPWRELQFAFNYLNICPRPDYNIMYFMQLVYDNSFHVYMNPLTFVMERFMVSNLHRTTSMETAPDTHQL